MIRRFIGTLLGIFAIYTLAGALQKPVFLLLYSQLAASPVSVGDYLATVFAGLAMDMSVAGYFTAFPAIALIAHLWLPGGKWWSVGGKIYFVVTAFALVAAAVVNLGLYGYWEFPLDMTPVFYFTTSPKAALASATPKEVAVGIMCIIILTALLYSPLSRIWSYGMVEKRGSRKVATLAGVVFLGLIFLAIRGGVTVSTMNLSRSYFSSEKVLNHAAVNPFFSLLYSATHQSRLSEQFRLISDEECEAIFDQYRTDDGAELTDTLFTSERPDVYLIILESFSSHLLPSLGGESIAVKLDSVGREGILFSDVYASSFRTDRALPAILGGFPGQPTTSLMKYPAKFERMQTLPGLLRDKGWENSYYYGGDANFTNMQAYLKSSGFEKVVSDKDFPLSERTGKWGAHDHVVFERALNDVVATAVDAAPQFRVIQTSSSHEPFEVPYHSHHAIPQANAFAYADSCVAIFLDGLKASERYDRSVIVLVPDHYGAYPSGLSGTADRHRIPIIITGGALSKRGIEIAKTAAQTDLAATFLGQLGIDSRTLPFSRNILARDYHPSAFFSDTSSAAFADSSGVAVLDIARLEADSCQTSNPELLPAVKAWLQRIYSEL